MSGEIELALSARWTSAVRLFKEVYGFIAYDLYFKGSVRNYIYIFFFFSFFFSEISNDFIFITKDFIAYKKIRSAFTSSHSFVIRVNHFGNKI